MFAPEFDLHLLEFDRVRRCRTVGGNSAVVWERIGVPRVPDQNLDVAVYLYESVEAAERGEEAGGTAFVIIVPFKTIPDRGILCLVTNKHVLQNAPVPRINLRGRGFATP